MAYSNVVKAIAQILGRSPKVINEAVKALGLNVKKIPFSEVLKTIKVWLGY